MMCPRREPEKDISSMFGPKSQLLIFGGAKLSEHTYTLVVDDLNNGDELAVVGALCEDGDTANLDQSPVACRNLCVAHCVGV